MDFFIPQIYFNICKYISAIFTTVYLKCEFYLRFLLILVYFSFVKGFMTRNDPLNEYNGRFIVYKKMRYLIQLSETLSKNLLDDYWPKPPSCCVEVNT